MRPLSQIPFPESLVYSNPFSEGDFKELSYLIDNYDLVALRTAFHTVNSYSDLLKEYAAYDERNATSAAALKLLYAVPYEELPLYINFGDPNNHWPTKTYRAIVRWRISLGK